MTAKILVKTDTQKRSCSPQTPKRKKKEIIKTNFKIFKKKLALQDSNLDTRQSLILTSIRSLGSREYVRFDDDIARADVMQLIPQICNKMCGFG